MAYSCTDFVDTILDALGIEVPEEAWDDPAAQADLALAAINGLRSANRAPGYFLSRGAANEVSHYLGTYHGHDDHSCEVGAALMALVNNEGPIVLVDDIEDAQPI